MRTVIVNSRGKVSPTRIIKDFKSITPLAIDFSLILEQVDSYTVSGDAPISSDSRSGTRVIVILDEGSAASTYNLTVTATGGQETAAVTIQIKVVDREAAYDDYCGEYI